MIAMRRLRTGLAAFPECLAVAALLLVAAPAAALAEDFPEEFAARKGTRKLLPTAPWNIDFGEDKCILSRMFEGEDGRHVIFFEQAAPGERFGMTMAGAGLRRFRMGMKTYLGMRTDVPFKPLSGERYGEVPSIGRAIIIANVYLGGANPEERTSGPRQAGIDLAGAGKVDRIVIKLGSSGLSFETGNLAAPVQALNVCTADLLRAWGLDPEKHEAYQPARWINSDPIVEAISANYPRLALYRGEQGIFRARLIVEADGSVSDCHIARSTETQDLETPACDELGKARFEPALDSDGKPMRSFHAVSISYVQ